MKKTNFKRILSLLLVCIAIIGAAVGISVSAEETTEPLKIVAKNVWQDEAFKLMYAVPKSAVDSAEGEVKVVIYDKAGEEFAATTRKELSYKVKGLDCYAFVADKGLPAQNLNTDLYAKLYVGDEVVDEFKYNLLQYYNEWLLVQEIKDDATTGVTAAQKRAMYEAIIAYAESAEIVLLNEKVAAEDRMSNYSYVRVENGTVDGYEGGMFKNGTNLTTIASTLEAGENQSILWTVTVYGVDGSVAYTDEEVKAGNIVVNGNMFITAELVNEGEEPEPVEPTKYFYEFTSKQFGENETKELGEMNWILAGTYTGKGYWGNDDTKGQQFGSGSAAYSALTLTSEQLCNEVTKIVINTSGASSIAASLTVTVGGVQIGDTISLTSAATEYEFTSDAPLSGQVVLSYTQTSSKAIYLKSISINPVPPTDEEMAKVELDAISGADIQVNADKTLELDVEPETYDATISWAIKADENGLASLAGNELTVTLGEEAGTVTLTVSVTVGEVTLTKDVTVNVAAKPSEPENPDQGGDEPTPSEPITVSKEASEINGLGTLAGGNLKFDEVITVKFEKAGGTSNPAYNTANNGEIRVYQNSAGTGGGTVTITAADGYKIAKIVITVTSSGKGPIKVSGGTADNANAPTNLMYTITADENTSEVVVTAMGTSSGTRLYIHNIEIIYEAV